MSRLVTACPKSRFGLCSVLLIALFQIEAGATTFADSVTDFSGTQGQDNWFYGFFDGPFESSDFQQMPLFGDFVGPEFPIPNTWSTFPSAPPFTFLNAEFVHSSLQAGQPTQWAVRRYVSDLNRTVVIQGRLESRNTGPLADGSTGRIFVDGVEVFSYSVANRNGIDYSVPVTLKVGATVDFALDPNSHDRYDTTKFTARIVPLPRAAVCGVALLGALGVIRAGSRGRSRSA